jgi:peptidoglycan/xylan/chitin deacetylase (PgdA/CDA1 family)
VRAAEKAVAARLRVLILMYHSVSANGPSLGWEEIQELRGGGIEFGSHCLSHRPLTELPADEVVREATRSKAMLERGFGVRIRALAYPYGASDRL